jgi:hypothetical protein
MAIGLGFYFFESVIINFFKIKTIYHEFKQPDFDRNHTKTTGSYRHSIRTIKNSPGTKLETRFYDCIFNGFNRNSQRAI